MGIVTVPVIAAFTHEGRQVNVGESVTVSPVTAAALHRRGLVSLMPGYQTRVLAPVELDHQAEPEAPVRKRRYRRRDMVAESS